MRSFGTYIAPLLLLGGCSLVNSLDDVKPQASTDGSGGKSGGAGGSDASVGGETSSGGKGSGGESTDAAAGGVTGSGGKGGAANETDAGDGGDFVPGGDDAVIVAYNKPTVGAPVPAPSLVVFDAKDGTVKSSEKIGSVRGIANDATTDYWFILEQVAGPTDPPTLHVRELRTADGKWKELGTLAGVPSPASQIVVLNGRIAYLSLPGVVAADPTTFSLTIIDTTDPTKPAILGGTAGARRGLPPGRKLGAVGKAAASIGGTVDVLLSASSCPQSDAGLAACDVTLAAYSIGTGATLTTGPTKKVGQVLDSGTVQIQRDTKRDAVVVAFPPLAIVSEPSCITNAAYSGVIEKYSPLDFSGVGQAPVSFPVESEGITGSAYDPCLDVMFLTTQNHDHALWAVPMGGGAPIKLCRGNGGATMYFEPKTRTMIRSLTGGGLPEFDVIGGSASVPTITGKTLDKLPGNFAPIIMATRQFKASCAQ